MLGKKVANRYEILEKLGGGGMALVYKAKDTLLNRIVTIKMLREEYANDEDFVRRFRHEAQAVASLSHPNIVNVFDVGYEAETHYIVMEYVEGENLKEIIRQYAPMSISEIVDIVKQICDGLEHAHENKIIHRDIKPHNILLTKNGRVKVADFGLARAVSNATVTHTKTVMGSVHYFSPEQAKGELTGEKSDIYSLGVVMYEMLTGKVPFAGGESPISIALKHIEASPEPPSKLNPEIPEYIEKIILKSMEKNINDRYTSVVELKQELERSHTKRIEPIDTMDKKDDEMEKTMEVPAVKEKDANKKDKKQKKRRMRPIVYFIIAALLAGIIGAGVWAFQQFLIVDEVEVPEVAGLTLFEANQKLANAGLNMEVGSRRHHPEIAKDRVISQRPEAGSIVKENRAITVDVSEGPVLSAVPDLIEVERVRAEIQLKNLGFEPVVDYEYNATIEQGRIIRQNPRPETMHPEGSEVIIVVSRGIEPRYILMPDLRGDTLTEAEEKLEELYLERGLVSYESSRQFFQGQIIKQDVEPNRSILQGETVNLVVSSGPGPVARGADVSIPLPRNDQDNEIKILVDDLKGERIAYQGTHRGGQTVTRRVEFFGDGTISVFINDELIREWDTEELI